MNMVKLKTFNFIFIGIAIVYLIFGSFATFIGWDNRCVKYDGFSACLFQQDFNEAMWILAAGIIIIILFFIIKKHLANESLWPKWFKTSNTILLTIVLLNIIGMILEIFYCLSNRCDWGAFTSAILFIPIIFILLGILLIGLLWLSFSRRI